MVRVGFEDESTKGEQDLPKLDREDVEEEEEVDMRKFETVPRRLYFPALQ